MFKKTAFVITLTGTFVISSFATAAVVNPAKNTKKHDKKPAVTQSVASSEKPEKKKKDDEKKQQMVVNEYQPALMKPASLRHFQQRQCHVRSQRIS